MERTYKTKSGDLLNCWYNDLGRIDIQGINGERFKREISIDLCGMRPSPHYTGKNSTFLWKGEEIEVENFEFIPWDELRARVDASEDRWGVMSDDALPTFMKDTDKVAIVWEAAFFETIVLFVGIALSGYDSNRAEVLMVPFEDRYKKKDWHYKIEFRAEQEDIQPYCRPERWYWSDFWSLVMSKHIKLVDKEKYRAEHPQDNVDNIRVSVMNM